MSEENKYKVKEKKYLGKLDLNGYHVILLEGSEEVIEIKISVKKKISPVKD